jgi:hypothetical protein
VEIEDEQFPRPKIGKTILSTTRPGLPRLVNPKTYNDLCLQSICRFTFVATSPLSPLHLCRRFTFVAASPLSPLHLCRRFTFVAALPLLHHRNQVQYYKQLGGRDQRHTGTRAAEIKDEHQRLLPSFSYAWHLAPDEIRDEQERASS